MTFDKMSAGEQEQVQRLERFLRHGVPLSLNEGFWLIALIWRLNARKP